MAQTSGKVCVVCGTDCAGKPRVKDPKGRYFCRPCYEEALQRKKAEADESVPGKPSAPPQPCPQCGAEVESGAVLCINCGYNFQTGDLLQPSVADSPSGERRVGGTVWPIVLGVISIVLALISLGNFGLGAMAAHAGPASPQDMDFEVNPWVNIACGGVLTVPLAILLLVGAIQLMRHDAGAVKLLRIWSWINVVLYGAFLVCIGGVLAILGPMAMAEIGGAEAAIGAGIIIAIILVVIVIFLGWPIFLLIWFRRSAIQKEIAQW